MKKGKTLHLEGAPIEVRGKAAERFWRLIKNPVKASPEEIEQMKRDYEYVKSISTCNLL